MEQIETKLFFRDRYFPAEEHVLNSIQNARKNSEFEKKFNKIIYLQKDEIKKYLPVFEKQGYEMMIAYLGENLFGHIAYQKHIKDNEENWKVFEVFIKDDFRENGYAHILTDKLVEYAEESGVDKIKFGKKGGHNSMKHLLNRLERIGLKVKNHSVKLDLFNSPYSSFMKANFPGLSYF